MNINMTKVANVILYMLHKQVKHLNDKKVSILLFLMDYSHQKHCGKKIFDEEYIKGSRHPEPVVLSELFDIIANGEDLEEDDERIYLMQELLDYLDIGSIEKENFIELSFIKMEEDFDETLFSKDEMKTIHKIVSQYLDTTPRNIANECFKIDVVRATAKNEIII
ncbi:MAG: type II toxin-antitoxin system antitoxin SocA domain-containing protein [Arcobacter sp.]|uniref:type II toxin-antitoxin system antitoxin SocA domain-containing protein n=1 Tax=Arcobacter sp. TaxID=1872629 RepID=UPI003D021973